MMSGWQDSNLRPPRPKRGAITGLRYAPIWLSSQKIESAKILYSIQLKNRILKNKRDQSASAY